MKRPRVAPNKTARRGGGGNGQVVGKKEEGNAQQLLVGKLAFEQCPEECGTKGNLSSAPRGRQIMTFKWSIGRTAANAGCSGLCWLAIVEGAHFVRNGWVRNLPVVGDEFLPLFFGNRTFMANLIGARKREILEPKKWQTKWQIKLNFFTERTNSKKHAGMLTKRGWRAMCERRSAEGE